MSNKLNTLFTIGYESKSFEDISKNIREREIPLLVDVRNVALSRKPGFSKNALKKNLGEKNIDYIHLRELGAPKPIRYKYYRNKDFKAFERAYKKHLKSTNVNLVKVLEILRENTACFLCFEKSHEDCHRSILAKEITKISEEKLEVEHL